MARYDSPAEIVPYSQRRADDFGHGFEPWPLETLVAAQRMECDGCTVEEIADALNLNVEDVRQRLAPAEARPAPRPERAGVGFPHLKSR